MARGNEQLTAKLIQHGDTFIVAGLLAAAAILAVIALSRLPTLAKAGALAWIILP